MELHTITIKDMQLQPVIGVYDAERSAGQLIVLNLTIKHTRSNLEDDLSATLDYDAVATAIATYAAEHKPYLIETFAHAVADLCLLYAEVQWVEVEVIKPEALNNGVVATVVTKEK